MRTRSFVLAALLSLPSAASAQASLSGDLIDYVTVGASGSMLGVVAVNRSMRYRESTALPFSCDAFSPGSPVETFTVEVNVAGTTRRLTNTSTASVFASPMGPMVVGREIRWSGEWREGMNAIAIDQVHTFAVGERVVHLTVTVRNTGTTTFPNLYYLRNADPDHGSCGIGVSTNTDNDVLLQPPGASSALVVAGGGDRAGAGRYLVLGIGSHDERARAHAGGFANTEASVEWLSPMDPAGASGDIGTDVVFFEPTAFGPGASTTFEILYVWGTSPTEVQMRFEDEGIASAPCAGADGTACTIPGVGGGRCYAGACCSGCWDATAMRCRAGRAASGCGRLGALCVACNDDDLCTSDVCTAGTCTYPNAPSGTSCDDGAFCTATDRCDGTGSCLGTGTPCDDMQSCTVDSCNELTRMCSNTVMPGVCNIAGACVPSGAPNPGNPCEVCDAARSATAYSPVMPGTRCGVERCSAGRYFPAGLCSTMGTCEVPAAMDCPTGMCSGSLCEGSCSPTSCASGEYCSTRTLMCEPLIDDGSPCSFSNTCRSGFCTDNVCCESACSGTCERCGGTGLCTPVANGGDPDRECAGDDVCDGMGMCRPPAMPDAGADAPADPDAPLPFDAGTDAPMAMDVGPLGDAPIARPDVPLPGVDAGAPPVDPRGCGCRAAPRSSPLGAIALVLGLALALARRR